MDFNIEHVSGDVMSLDGKAGNFVISFTAPDGKKYAMAMPIGTVSGEMVIEAMGDMAKIASGFGVHDTRGRKLVDMRMAVSNIMAMSLFDRIIFMLTGRLPLYIDCMIPKE